MLECPELPTAVAEHVWISVADSFRSHVSKPLEWLGLPCPAVRVAAWRQEAQWFKPSPCFGRADALGGGERFRCSVRCSPGPFGASSWRNQGPSEPVELVVFFRSGKLRRDENSERHRGNCLVSLGMCSFWGSSTKRT